MLRLLKALPLALAIAALFLFTGCGSSNSQARFVNAISDDTQQLDIFFNGTRTFPGVAPSPSFSASTYSNIPAGSDTIAGYVAGSTTNPLFSETSPVSFNSGSGYTIVATGSLSSGSITFLTPTDNNTEPADGMVAFRVIDAASEPSAVDVWILANPVTESLSQIAPTISNLTSPAAPTTAVSGYQTMSYNSNAQSPGYTLFVATHGSTNPIVIYTNLNAGSVSLGSIRTLVLVDSGDINFPISSTPLVLDDLN